MQLVPELPELRENRQSTVPRQGNITTSRPRLPIATGWVMNEKGEIFLTTTTEKVTPYGSLQPYADCVRE
jgi:hypothetical protein